MAKSWHSNTKASTTNETGFGTNSTYSGGRFYRKNGSANLTVKGVQFWEKFSLYNRMLQLSSLKFIGTVVLFYFVTNVLFAVVYLLVGIEHLGGISEHTPIGQFWEAFFFSSQTLSTVGYGHVFPSSLLANTIASCESVLGLLTIALITGMMYGRFSQPKAYLRFSENALFAPYENGLAIMFRFAAYKHNHLMDAEVKVTLVMKDEVSNRNIFYNLPLELNKVNSLTLSWTIVHPINESSPFYNLTIEEMINGEAEMLVFTKAYDETFANTVVARTSYVATEFVYGAKFNLMYHPSEDRQSTILEMDKLNDYTKVEIATAIV
jgi:inward rectifier potassium channel